LRSGMTATGQHEICFPTDFAVAYFSSVGVGVGVAAEMVIVWAYGGSERWPCLRLDAEVVWPVS
jgi:hypothetical protein